MILTKFALDLFRRLCGNGGNVFVSPFSIQSSVLRAAIGARGETRRQMLGVMDVEDRSDHALAVWLFGLEEQMRNLREIEFNVANRIYAQSGFAFVDDYIQLMEQFAGLDRVNFMSDPDGVIEKINTFVRTETRNKIDKMLKKGDVDGATRMAIANAIYLKSKWQRMYDVKLISRETFYLADGSHVTVPLMYQKGEYMYAESDGFHLLEQPYVGGRLSMLNVVPRDKVPLTSVLTDVFNGALAEAERRLRPLDVEVHMPEHEMRWGTHDVSGELQAMGMTHAFRKETADFSGMCTAEPLWISGVHHHAYRKVDAEGTEAAAATVTTIRAVTAIMPTRRIIVRMDKPYMDVILDRQTGQIVFVGQVGNPAAGA